MSGEGLPPWGYRDDDEMLADLAEGLLEREADRLIATLLATEHTVAAQDPALLVALDANAAAYGDARDTWLADLRCGDLPFARANGSAVDLGMNARNRMYGIILVAGNPPDWGGERRREYDALQEAAAALHHFLADLDGDTYYDLAEYVAGALGGAGPRYVLGP